MPRREIKNNPADGCEIFFIFGNVLPGRSVADRRPTGAVNRCCGCPNTVINCLCQNEANFSSCVERTKYMTLNLPMPSFALPLKNPRRPENPIAV